MSVELSADSFLNKMKNGLSNAKQTIVGENGKKVAAIIAGVILSNGLAMGQANANANVFNTIDTNNKVEQKFDLDIQEKKDFLERFNVFYTSEQQENVILSGYYIAEKTNTKYSGLKDLVEISDSAYMNFINRVGESPRAFTDVDYAEKLSEKAKNEGYSIDDLPQYIVSGVDSIYPTYDELTPMQANLIVAKAEKFYSYLDEKPYNNAEDAVMRYTTDYANKIRHDDGVWSLEKDDMTYKSEDIAKDFKNGLKKVNPDDLARYLEHPDTYKDLSSNLNIDNILNMEPTPTSPNLKEDLTKAFNEKDIFKNKDTLKRKGRSYS